MISNKHLREELDVLDKEHKNLLKENLPFEASLLKANILIIKLLANMRTNQALALQGSGIDLIPRRIENEETQEGSI